MASVHSFVFAILLITCVICLVYLLKNSNNYNRNFDTIKYYRIPETFNTTEQSIPLLQVMQNVLDEENQKYTQSDINNANFILFETLNYIDQNINKPSLQEIIKKARFIYGVGGSDLLASKSAFADIMKTHHLEEYIPKTYIVDNEKDMMLLKSSHDPSKIYIMKKNIQRQEGILLSRSIDEILSQSKSNYVVVQEMLQNPMLISGRKINMRLYMLVSISGNTCTFHIYRNGFMYYTPGMFMAHSTDTDNTITSGYVDRQIYVDNPLTLFDLQNHIGRETYLVLWNKIRKMMSKLANVYKPILLSTNKTNFCSKTTRFLIYGIDIAPDVNMDVKIMEVNKGPDLGYKDDRDREVKYNLVKDAFDIVGLSSKRQRQVKQVNNFELV